MNTYMTHRKKNTENRGAAMQGDKRGIQKIQYCKMEIT